MASSSAARPRGAASRAALVALVVAALAPARAARAQNASNQAAAEALFDQGKAAMAAKNYAVACPKFFESNRLDEGIGTSLWLADCYEKNGQTASAWAQFREAAALAVKTTDPREKVARKRAQALEPRLSRLVLSVPPSARLPGLRVARDGGEVGPPLWGTSVPLDPGRHTVVVSAPDHRPETLSIDIRPGPGEQTLHIPVLAEPPSPPPPAGGVAASEPPPSSDAAPPPKGMPAQRIAAIGVVAAGVVGVALASYFGIAAKSDLADSNGVGHCSAQNICNPTGVSDRSSAESAATVSTVLFIVGGAALAGGVVLWLTAPHGTAAPDAPSHASASIVPWVDPRSHGAGGVVLGADF